MRGAAGPPSSSVASSSGGAAAQSAKPASDIAALFRAQPPHTPSAGPARPRFRLNSGQQWTTTEVRVYLRTIFARVASV